MVGISADGVDRFQTLLRPLLALGQQIGIAENGRHGRADFVAHVREKFALGQAGRLGFRRHAIGVGGLFKQSVAQCPE